MLLPAARLNGRKEVQIERERDGLEPLVYSNIEDMHRDYKADVVSHWIITRPQFLFQFVQPHDVTLVAFTAGS